MRVTPLCLRLSALACTALALAACGPKRIDASSDERLKGSIQAVKESLPDEKKTRFENAVQAIAFKDVRSLADMMNPDAQISKAKDRLNGKTADEVIAEGDALIAEKKAGQRRQIEGEIKELEDKKSKAGEAAEKLKAVVVDRSRFYWQDNSFSKDPIIELSVKNGASVALSRLFFHGVLATPGRSVPWVSDDFNYEVPGGIEPGESKSISLDANQFSAWGSAPSDRKDMVMTVSVIRCNGADGKPLYDAEFPKEDEERLDELKRQLTTL